MCSVKLGDYIYPQWTNKALVNVTHVYIMHVGINNLLGFFSVQLKIYVISLYLSAGFIFLEIE